MSADEFVQLWDIEKLLKQQLARKLIDGFEPDHDVPVSDLSKRPKKPKQTNTQGRRGNNQKPKSRRKKPSNKNQRKSSGNNSGGGNRTPRKR